MKSEAIVEVGLGIVLGLCATFGVLVVSAIVWGMLK